MTRTTRINGLALGFLSYAATFAGAFALVLKVSYQFRHFKSVDQRQSSYDSAVGSGIPAALLLAALHVLVATAVPALRLRQQFLSSIAAGCTTAVTLYLFSLGIDPMANTSLESVHPLLEVGGWFVLPIVLTMFWQRLMGVASPETGDGASAAKS